MHCRQTDGYIDEQKEGEMVDGQIDKWIGEWTDR